MSGSVSKLGLACAGGGIEGAVYEIGVLCALDESINGLDFNDLHVYVGVSAGAFITSCLANDISPWRLSTAIVSHVKEIHPITPSTFFRPAVKEYVERFERFPRTFYKSLADYVENFSNTSFLSAMAGLSDILPVGLFDSDPIREYLAKNFTTHERTDDFRELNKKLRIVATDLDSGQSIKFGSEGYDDVPISRAVQASSALPAIYLPVEINGRHYVDGVARRTVHASVALQEGSELVFCVNPIVPIDNGGSNLLPDQDKLRFHGLPTVLSQTFRTMIYSRMKVGIKAYKNSYPDSDILLFEPKSDDYRMFFNNIFSFSSRKEVIEHAYQTTRADLLERADEIGPILEKHGLSLRMDALLNKTKTLYEEGDDGKPSSVMNTLDKTLDYLDAVLDRI